jgi:hypothetical protein
MKCGYFVVFCLLLPSQVTLPTFSVPEGKSVAIAGGFTLLGFVLAYIIFWNKSKKLTKELQDTKKINDNLSQNLGEVRAQTDSWLAMWKKPNPNSIAATLLREHKNDYTKAHKNLMDLAALAPAVYVNSSGNLCTTQGRLVGVTEE